MKSEHNHIIFKNSVMICVQNKPYTIKIFDWNRNTLTIFLGKCSKNTSNSKKKRSTLHGKAVTNTPY